MEISKKTFLKLPEVPGVYTFWKEKKPIYIGKSINLKSRLNSYLDLNLAPKTAQMMSEADDLTFTEVISDLESLLLESHQVKTFKPKYNILLKDDKHALYIVITKEEFPRLLAVRKIEAIRSNLYSSFGPFPNSSNVKYILKMLRKIFPYSDHKISKKPCLYSHIGLCNPCPNEILQSTESLALRKIYLNNIRNIKLVLSRKFNIVRKSLESEMNTLSKEQRYEEAAIIREKIRALDYITQEKIDTQEFLQNPNLVDDIRSLEINNLRILLNENSKLEIKNLRRIECFDIAHLSGVAATASMVVSIDGEMDHSEYKHFKIIQKNSQSDYDSMREIANRRLKNIKNWGKPDLVVVDGGLGQVKIFNKIFSSVNIPVVGIAKHPDRLVFEDGIKIRLQKDVLRLVSRMRDEAHRFARRLHHKQIVKKLIP